MSMTLSSEQNSSPTPQKMNEFLLVLMSDNFQIQLNLLLLLTKAQCHLFQCQRNER